jgi:hypothetical protein
VKERRSRTRFVQCWVLRRLESIGTPFLFRDDASAGEYGYTSDNDGPRSSHELWVVVLEDAGMMRELRSHTVCLDRTSAYSSGTARS